MPLAWEWAWPGADLLWGMAFTRKRFCSGAWEWAGGVAMFGKAKSVLARSGCGFGIYYTGNGEPVIKGAEAES